MYGFIGKVLRVDLSSGALSEEAISEEDARLFLGGSGLATKYLIDELAPGVDPLGPENKLIYMTGPLTGTASPSAGRFAAVAKSPLTGLWGEANSGGRWGCDLKRSGYDGIIIEGKAAAPVVLVIDNGKARLQDAASLWGKNVFDQDYATSAYSRFISPLIFGVLQIDPVQIDTGAKYGVEVRWNF